MLILFRKQRIISFDDFAQYMKENFKKEYNEFVESGKSVDDFSTIMAALMR